MAQTIRDEVIEELLEGVQRAQVLLGEGGLSSSSSDDLAIAPSSPMTVLLE
jgi:hypothetical protein